MSGDFRSNDVFARPGRDASADPFASSLAEAARRALESGALPPGEPAGYWGGAGSGEACAVCAAPVPAENLELELEFPRDAAGHKRSYHLHVPCYAAWQRERHAFIAGREGAGPTTATGGLPSVPEGRKIRARERDSQP